ncbi:nuclear transport factor 2 family protein [Flavobacterium sp. MC2016-06]|jgi:hypothetical protein|uniref:nuclear transport factor 2 family protein n=1 Tax=Flavobacterium sp. MC2016-06 TaxID=2676308 RepID=UPI0012BA5F7C|nr:nuclear transport factor 2 family protein [Flavobacterium sp. MC2016-06]MBU3861748.1 nuclear transport factor 2 family protein [Flavobacterium sp. MC2016-06]
MPKLETIEKFISMVESNEHDKAIEKFYTEDASMQENQSPQRVGRNLLVANEQNVLAKVKSLFSKCIRPVFINEDLVVIQWYFKFEWKDGTVSEIEEIAYQNWEGEFIKKEKFFYDPK